MLNKLKVPLKPYLKNQLISWAYTQSWVDRVYCFLRHFPCKVSTLRAKLPEQLGGTGEVKLNFIFNRYGEENSDSPLYLVNIDQPMGLMAYFVLTIELLAVCETFTLTPVIYWNARLYWKDSEKLSANVFDYFFQPSEISLQEAMRSACATAYRVLHRNRIFAYSDSYGMVITDRDIAYVSDIIRRHIRLNRETEEHISKCISNVLGGKKTLGIHVRGSGYKAKALNHPVHVEPTEHITEAKKAINECGFERIFLATDEEETISQFKDAFNDMVVTYDNTTRLAPGDSSSDQAMLAIDMIGSRPDHSYLMGLEVLTDAYTLAACQGLIAGLSNVSNSAVYINGGKYEYKKIIYKGIYGYDIPFERTEINSVQFDKAFKRRINSR